MKNVRFATKPMRYWNYEKNSNVRNFFEKFAKSKNMNPQEPITWYTLALELSKLKVSFLSLRHHPSPSLSSFILGSKSIFSAI
jgi:hypothetical protein